LGGSVGVSTFVAISPASGVIPASIAVHASQFLTLWSESVTRQARISRCQGSAMASVDAGSCPLLICRYSSSLPDSLVTACAPVVKGNYCHCPNEVSATIPKINKNTIDLIDLIYYFIISNYSKIMFPNHQTFQTRPVFEMVSGLHYSSATEVSVLFDTC
jgi:hypothetical protein